MLKKHYKARPGGRLNDAEAEIVGKELERLEKTDGKIIPERVVELAKSRRSPLHNYFTWDDEEAANRHRLEEARALIRSIVVEYEIEREQKTMVRAFYNVTDEKKGRGYVNLKDINDNKGYRQQILDQALKELRSWADRYRMYEEFSDIIKAIDKLAVNV